MEEQNKDPRSPQPNRSKGQRPAGNNEGLSNYVFGKVQPQATSLEDVVLGALMLDREALPLVMDILRPESFYLEAHQHIYRAIVRLFERSNPVDLLTVTEELRKSGDLDKIGGGYYLVELTNRIASAANIEYHARIIAQKHIQRELIQVSTRIIRDAYEDTTDVFTLLDDAEKGLFAITQNNLSRTFETMGSLSSKVLKLIEEVAGKPEGLTGVPTGFTDLDRLTSGWQPSDLIIIAARPGMGKCLGRGTRVLQFDGTLKNVEDILPGDLLMGDDSSPRRVLSIARGREQMYWVRQNKGLDYRVNESHILALKRSRTEWSHQNGDILEISVRDWLAQSPKFRTNYKGYKVAVEFPEKSLPLPPYFVGLWLGDGTSTKAEITTTDAEIVDYLTVFAQDHHFQIKKHQAPNRCPIYAITGETRNSRSGLSLLSALRRIDVVGNKHIPHDYLINSTQNRLALLAGLLDTDGHYLVQSNGYEITQKNGHLARQIKFLGDSLGFRTSIASKKASVKSIGYETTVFRVRLYGDVHTIPVRLSRKVANPWQSPVNWQVTGITVEADGEDDYFGFELDGNGRFLLEDMTVTHNTSAVLAMALNAARDFNKGVALFSLEMANTQLVQRLISMESEIPASKMRNGKLEDYEWHQLQSTVERLSTVPIYIDDTPAINIFELRAKCRRLKMQHDIQLVIVDYLQLMTGASENSKGGGNREQEIASISRALKSLAKEINVPVIALSQLSRAVETRGGTKRPQLSDLRESGCLTGDTLIVHAVSGQRLTIKELSEQRERTWGSTPSLDGDMKVAAQPISNVFYSGHKLVFELKTRSGRRIKATANHPFFKINGWTRLDALQAGDRIALPRKIKVSNPCNPMCEDELILLAHLIGDGCILPKQPYHYTSEDEANLAIVCETARRLFHIEARIVPQKNWRHAYLPAPFRLTHGKANPITEWYARLGLERVRSYDKQLPAALFQSDEARIALFLQHLWATDGNISWKKLRGRKDGVAIYYATTSAIMAEQIQHLLLRLGIWSTLRITTKAGYRPNFQVHVTGMEHQTQFLRQVGCYGKRGHIIPDLLISLAAIRPNPNTDIIPKEAWKAVVDVGKVASASTWRAISAGLEMQYCGSTLFKSGISRERMSRLSHLLAFDPVTRLAESDIFWDEIASITPLGEEDVYDATIPTTHNFVANDIIVHNSIEQDADIVSFIYRPEYYQILEDETGQSLKGVAEFIIAKHRNGALDTVKLKFTDTFAKFSNLNDPAFNGLGAPLTGPFTPSVVTRGSRMNDEDIPF